MKERQRAVRRHAINMMLAKVKVSQGRACKLMRISEQTFIKMKSCYLNEVSNNKLMILAGILGCPIWELIYILERSRQLTLDDKQYISTKIKTIDIDHNFLPFQPYKDQQVTKRL